MESDDIIETEGTVIELLPNSKVKVALPNGHKILTDLTGTTTVLPGDKVKVKMSLFDLTRGRITSKDNG